MQYMIHSMELKAKALLLNVKPRDKCMYGNIMVMLAKLSEM